jgi:hypothetical protein
MEDNEHDGQKEQGRPRKSAFHSGNEFNVFPEAHFARLHTQSTPPGAREIDNYWR